MSKTKAPGKEYVYDLLEKKYREFNRLAFIENDPIMVPHRFTKKQDIEIAGFFAAMLAWGQRVTIIRSANRIIELMDGSPHDFILNHQEKDLKRFLGFVHRTFNDTDLLYFIAFFHRFYGEHDSLEAAFTGTLSKRAATTESALVGFHDLFFSLEDHPHRTKKHIATPMRKSTCKRLNMFRRLIKVVYKNTAIDNYYLWFTYCQN